MVLTLLWLWCFNCAGKKLLRVQKLKAQWDENNEKQEWEDRDGGGWEVNIDFYLI